MIKSIVILNRAFIPIFFPVPRSDRSKNTKKGPNVTKKTFISTSAFRKHSEQKHAIAPCNI